MTLGNAKKLTIAIDGPAGAGKSTVARKVAELLGYDYIDTGAMYRAVTLNALDENADLEDYEAVSRLAQNCSIEFEGNLVFLDGKDVTIEIRSPRINKNVSLVARIPGVRKALIESQRQYGRMGGVVIDGRDIGTVVLPDADKKFFLTASVDERAKRRYNEMVGKGFYVSLEDVLEDVKTRDRIDSTRQVAPLKAAPDAQVVDTTDCSIEEVVSLIINSLDISETNGNI
jgi:cytidylate kinase